MGPLQRRRRGWRRAGLTGPLCACESSFLKCIHGDHAYIVPFTSVIPLVGAAAVLLFGADSRAHQSLCGGRLVPPCGLGQRTLWQTGGRNEGAVWQRESGSTTVRWLRCGLLSLLLLLGDGSHTRDWNVRNAVQQRQQLCLRDYWARLWAFPRRGCRRCRRRKRLLTKQLLHHGGDDR